MTDYHDFTGANTPRDERRRLNVGDIWINAATCGQCGDYVRSRNRHDFVTCSCGNVSVDGGSWYAKRSFRTTNYVNEIVAFADAREMDDAA